MSTETRPRLDEPSGASRPDEAADIGPLELLRRLYALFYNKRFGLGLILAMVVCTLLGVLFPQASDEVRANPEFFATWLDEMRPRYRGWTDILAAIGVFGVFSSWWFKTATVLLALSIAACTAHRLPLLWQQATRPHTHVTDGFFSHARLNTQARVAASPAEALARTGAALRSRRFRVIEDAARGSLYADRNRFAPLGTVVAHVAFVVILAGVLVTSTFGFRNDDFSVTVGSRVEVGNGSGLAVEARQFSDVYHPDGRPADYASELVLFSDGRQVAEQTVRVNTPLRYGGYSFNQASFGIAAELSIQDASGATLFSGGVPLRWSTEDKQHTYGKLSLPAQHLQVYVVMPASGKVDPRIGPGQAQVEVYPEDQDTPLASQVLDQGRSGRLGELTVTFARERQYTGLMVSRDPGEPIVWLGATLLMIGTCLTMFLRHRRIWVAVSADAGGSLVRLASPDRHDSIFESQFRTLAASLGEPHHHPEGSDHA